MIDTNTNKPIKVLTHDIERPIIILPRSQLQQVRKLLSDNGIQHEASDLAISLDGRPAVITIYLRRGTDASKVQAILDQAHQGNGDAGS